jgi:putative membrane protein
MQRFSYPDIHPYQGAEIDVTGFVGYSKRNTLGQFLVNRMTLTCCIQDPVPVGLAVAWKSDKPLAENIWVRVRGTVNILDINGESFPEILAQQVDIIPQPNQPYLFPK